MNSSGWVSATPKSWKGCRTACLLGLGMLIMTCGCARFTPSVLCSDSNYWTGFLEENSSSLLSSASGGSAFVGTGSGASRNVRIEAHLAETDKLTYDRSVMDAIEGEIRKNGGKVLGVVGPEGVRDSFSIRYKFPECIGALACVITRMPEETYPGNRNLNLLIFVVENEVRQ